MTVRHLRRLVPPAGFGERHGKVGAHLQVLRRGRQHPAEMRDGRFQVAGLRGKHPGEGDEAKLVRLLAEGRLDGAPRPGTVAAAEQIERGQEGGGGLLGHVVLSEGAGDVEGDGQPLARGEGPGTVPH